MKISQLILRLRAAQSEYGDLEVFTMDSDIDRLLVHPTRDGVARVINGVSETPNELTLEFIPK